MVRHAVRAGRLRWRAHALERMLSRGIATTDARLVLLEGEVVEDYADDRPHPSALLLGRVGRRPLHVVVAYDGASDYAYVVTAYEPDLKHFFPDYRTRRPDE